MNLIRKSSVFIVTGTSDNDFLKRSFASEYTEIVLKRRIEQSRYILFLQTNNSVTINGDFISKWVKMEIEYSKKISKEIYCLNFCGGNAKFKNIEFDFMIIVFLYQIMR